MYDAGLGAAPTNQTLLEYCWAVHRASLKEDKMSGREHWRLDWLTERYGNSTVVRYK